MKELIVHQQKQPGKIPILIILLLAFILRFTAVWFGLPALFHADEPIVVNHALAYGTLDFNPHFFRIPPLVSYLLFMTYGLFYVAGNLIGWFTSIPAFERFFYQDPAIFYFIARFIFGVILGTLTVYVIYKIIRRHFSYSKALSAAFFMAVCFLHVRDSHYVYADIPLVFVLSLMIGSLFVLMKNPQKLRNHIWAGILTGLAAAVKYNGGIMAVPYVYVLLTDRQKSRWIRNGMIYGLSAALVYGLLNPFSLLDLSFFLKEMAGETAAHQGGTGVFHHLSYSLFGALGSPLLTAFLGGMIFSLLRKNMKGICLSLFVLVYYLILCVAGQPYDRYVLPLMPFAVILASDFLGEITRIIPKGRVWFFAALAFFCALPTLRASILFDWLMLARDTRTQAREWIEIHIPANSKIAVTQQFHAPRLLFNEKQMLEKKDGLTLLDNHFSAKMRRLEFYYQKVRQRAAGYELYFLNDQASAGELFEFAQPIIPFSMNALREKGIEYVVVPRLGEKQGHQSFFDQLAQSANVVAEFSPYKDPGQKWPFDSIAMTGGPFLLEDLTQRVSNGQPITIYRLGPKKNAVN